MRGPWVDRKLAMCLGNNGYMFASVPYEYSDEEDCNLKALHRIMGICQRFSIGLGVIWGDLAK